MNNKPMIGKYSVRDMSVTAMLGAVAFILMFVDFPIPMLMPTFIKMDLSDLPALIGAFAIGPVCGVLVEALKILLHLIFRGTSTGFVGEFSNFILGVLFVVPAGLIYKHKKTKGWAMGAGVIGAFVMGIGSIVTNYLIVYPVYYNFMPQDVILKAYQAIIPAMKSILQCLICFNFPFTTVKGLLSVLITMFIYQPLRPLLKGRI